MAIRSMKDFKQNLSLCMNRVRQEPLVITKHGRPWAGVLPLADDFDVEVFLVSNSRRLMDLFNQRLAAEGRRYSRKEVVRAVEEADRKERKTRRRAA